MKRTLQRRRRAESGVSLIEMMIAILVLTVGLVSLAQLFTVATLNNMLAVTTSGGVNDAQRLVEAWKAEAMTNGITSAAIRSATYQTSTHECAAFVALAGYDSTASLYRENVWVFDWNGDLVGSANPTMPPGVAAGTLRSPAVKSRLVYIRLDPKSPDPRANQTVIVTAIVAGK